MVKNKDQFTSIKYANGKPLPTTQESLGESNELLKTLRKSFNEYKGSFSGAYYADPAAIDITTSAIEQSNILKAIKEQIGEEALLIISQRFDGNAHRTKMDIPEHLRPAMLRIIAAELIINSTDYDIKPKDIASFTVYNGAKSSEHLTRHPEFGEYFQDFPYVFKSAVVRNPKDPEGFLKKVKDKIEDLKANPEFEEFQKTPSIFKRTAINNPKDPEGFLRNIKQKISSLNQDEKYSEFFKDYPYIFKLAATGHPKDPEAFLDGVIDKYHFLKDEFFAHILSRRLSDADLIAAATLGKTAKPFLNKVAQEKKYTHGTGHEL